MSVSSPSAFCSCAAAARGALGDHAARRREQHPEASLERAGEELAFALGVIDRLCGPGIAEWNVLEDVAHAHVVGALGVVVLVGRAGSQSESATRET
jgi:hypothetical protein